jgi:tetratricopeptide (TPR) repeat protein
MNLMFSKRAAAVAAMFLLPMWSWAAAPEPGVAFGGDQAAHDPLAQRAKGEISGLEVRQDETGRWMVDFDYRYEGEFINAFLLIKQVRASGARSIQSIPVVTTGSSTIKYHRSHELLHPGNSGPAALDTSQSVLHVEVEMQVASRGRSAVIASQRVSTRIDWPDWDAWQLARKPNDVLLAEAVELIDKDDPNLLSEAKRILEVVLQRDPRLAAGYVELARVATRADHGPDGFRHAESLLRSARQISPDDANAKIMMAYVYAHQGRYAQAEALLVESARTGTKNLWLWANWGQLLAMQGKTDASIQKYRETLRRPPTGDTYDHARLFAYDRLIRVLDERRDLDGLGALYKQRLADYGSDNCHGIDYARFLVIERADASSALGLAEATTDVRCTTYKREVMGLAHYVAWSKASGARRDDLLNQARVYLPGGPHLWLLLALGDKTAPVMRQLVAAGNSIEQRDNDRLNALAHALLANDHRAAERLIRAGARADAPIGPSDLPVAMLPIMNGSAELTRSMVRLGVDYSKLRFQGASALDWAKRSGDPALVEALDPKRKSL